MPPAAQLLEIINGPDDAGKYAVVKGKFESKPGIINVNCIGLRGNVVLKNCYRAIWVSNTL